MRGGRGCGGSGAFWSGVHASWCHHRCASNHNTCTTVLFCSSCRLPRQILEHRGHVQRLLTHLQSILGKGVERQPMSGEVIYDVGVRPHLVHLTAQARLERASSQACEMPKSPVTSKQQRASPSPLVLLRTEAFRSQLFLPVAPPNPPNPATNSACNLARRLARGRCTFTPPPVKRYLMTLLPLNSNLKTTSVHHPLTSFLFNTGAWEARTRPLNPLSIKTGKGERRRWKRVGGRHSAVSKLSIPQAASSSPKNTQCLQELRS